MVATVFLGWNPLCEGTGRLQLPRVIVALVSVGILVAVARTPLPRVRIGGGLSRQQNPLEYGTVTTMQTTPTSVLSAGLLLLLMHAGTLVAATEIGPGAGKSRKSECEFMLRDFEPRSARTTIYRGRDAVLFFETITGRDEPLEGQAFDRVVLKSGDEVFGGTVALIAKGECVLGHGFFSVLEYIHATQVLKLYTEHPDLQQVQHLEPARLRSLAESGNGTAQFHVGLTLALGGEQRPDRAAGLAWLRRSAEQRYAPGMLALGMALSGPGRLEDEVVTVGAPPRTDEFTDWVQACYWLNVTAACEDPAASSAARQELDFYGLESMMTAEQRAECRRLLEGRR